MTGTCTGLSHLSLNFCCIPAIHSLLKDDMSGLEEIKKVSSPGSAPTPLGITVTGQPLYTFSISATQAWLGSNATTLALSSKKLPTLRPMLAPMSNTKSPS